MTERKDKITRFKTLSDLQRASCRDVGAHALRGRETMQSGRLIYTPADRDVSPSFLRRFTAGPREPGKSAGLAGSWRTAGTLGGTDPAPFIPFPLRFFSVFSPAQREAAKTQDKEANNAPNHFPIVLQMVEIITKLGFFITCDDFHHISSHRKPQ